MYILIQWACIFVQFEYFGLFWHHYPKEKYFSQLNPGFALRLEVRPASLKLGYWHGSPRSPQVSIWKITLCMHQVNEGQFP